MNKQNKPKHIFFDLDHTLWDFDKNSALTFEKIFQLNKIDINLDHFLKIYVPLNLAYWKLYRENKIDKESLRYKRLADTFNKINFEVPPRVINKLSDDYITYLSTFNHLLDGALEVLEYLKINYSLHIITNGFQEVQQGKLNKANIDHYFETVTNSEMAGVKKPHPKIFELALAKARANKEESMMIGDNYEADILGAKNMGMECIYYNYHKEPSEIDVIEINHLNEIKTYL